ncbi:hypothetical protein [Paenibacillus odorifer]|uniref:hypothetical protein n=1 Tax=Paenibacillus odorifer TaxID=189426 RepID=UPI00096CE85F|nr:hypothetical protein [Paenibacillus odorifer]OMD61699.1 hypothetical protein BSK55_03780 [Paenibacillus odorifer]
MEKRKKIVKKAYVDPTGQGEDEPARYKIVKIKTIFDPHMISRILNNNKNASKGRTSPNPFLIPTPRSNTDNGYHEILQKNLRFDSIHEMLWGTSEEKNDYTILIFISLINDLLNTEEDFSKEIKEILVDYIPFAKNQTFFEMFITQEIEIPYLPNQKIYKLPPYFYGITEDSIFEDQPLVRFEAIVYLYSKCGQEFEGIFNEFVDERSNLKNLNRDLRDFAHNSLKEMLNGYKPNENSLGMRVRNLLRSDWKAQADLEFQKTKRNQSNNTVNIKEYLVESSLQYIKSLEYIQQKMIENNK